MMRRVATPDVGPQAIPFSALDKSGNFSPDNISTTRVPQNLTRAVMQVHDTNASWGMGT